jgi:hypothetical protein
LQDNWLTSFSPTRRIVIQLQASVGAQKISRVSRIATVAPLEQFTRQSLSADWSALVRLRSAGRGEAPR